MLRTLTVTCVGLMAIICSGCGAGSNPGQAKELRDLQATVAALQRQAQAAAPTATSPAATVAATAGVPAATAALRPSTAPIQGIQQQLNSAVSVTLDQKGFIQGDIQSYNTYVLSFKNNTSKDMRGVKGIATFNDVFGDKILSVNVSYDQPIPAGQVAIWDAESDYNQFIQGDVKLKDTPQDRIQFVFQPQTILFADGSRLDINGS